MSRLVFRIAIVATSLLAAGGRAANCGEQDDFFESRIRPLLIERCHKCHAGSKSKGGLRLHSPEAIRRGGDAGPVLLPGKPDESLLIRAIRYQNEPKMPPDGKLKEAQIADLVAWVKSGARWPESTTKATSPAQSPATITLLAPDDGELRPSLQLWLSADSLGLNDGEPVHVWPDRSGHGRDVSATRGVRADGVGLPGKFAKMSTLLKRPAVRFETGTGFASSPDNPVDIRGDAALSITVVINLQPHEAKPPADSLIGLGNPASAADPGRPLGALVQINRDEDHALHLAGGWKHDANLGKGSFQPHYGKTIILTVTKQPGPIRATTRFFINGDPVTAPAGGADDIPDTPPDIQHRTNIGVFLGKAASWSGAIQGDVGEVLVYNRALSDVERLGVEGHLADRYGLILNGVGNLAARAVFAPEELGFWAYQPVKDTDPPVVRNEAWIQTPVDRFILAKLEDLGLSPAPPAEKIALLRRTTFDLTGLPPTPEEVAAFLADDTPQAFAKVVDRLLDSPHYGERWGRHWLDVVRFAESTANDANAVMRYAWRYRNYVIDAFNRDLPYDQFLIEQLAGDLLPPADSVETNTRRMIATGYLMVGPKALAETDKEQSRLDIVDDQIDVTGRAMLGLTVACARCHDHKFDAIRATDYYAIAGVFRSTEPFQNEVRNATMWWEQPVPQGSGQEPLVVMAPKETLPKHLRIHLRGNRFTLGAVVPRGVLQVVEAAAQAHRSAFVVEPGIGSGATSGRLELARWIAHRSNPLTARVMVNRIWQNHFGRGLVATSDNFGVRGERPTHPALLDFLAARFVESGWSIKGMHRMILLSSAYRQSGQSSAAARQADPDQRWLSSFPRRRLSAEELRDAILAVSGKLDRSPGSNESGEYLVGKAEDIKSMIMPNRIAVDDPIYTTFSKRSIYLPFVRNMLPDVMALFDAADPNGVTAVRNDTTVSSQALFLLNSPFVRDQAKAFAEHLLADENATDEARIDRAHLLAFGRRASPSEQSEAREFVSHYLAAQATQARPEVERRSSAWQSYCQILLCQNEFLYLE